MASTITRMRRIQLGSRRGVVALFEASAANDETEAFAGDVVWHAYFQTCDGASNNTGVNRNADQNLGDSLLVPSHARQRLTMTGNAVATNTVTIDTTVYTFEATPSSAFDVDVGVDTSTSLDNLVAAINLTGTAGTEYAAGTTIHPTVSAERGPSGSLTMIVTAKTAGTDGNSIVSTETLTNGSWKNAALQGAGTATIKGKVLHNASPTGTNMVYALNK